MSEISVNQMASFSKRLNNIRECNSEELRQMSLGYKNGSIAAIDQEASNWDNYDRYYKFFNISTVPITAPV